MRRLTLAIAAVLVAAVACWHTPPFRFASELDTSAGFHYELDVDAFALKNGLTVVLAPRTGTNLVTVDTRYEVGSVDEPAGKSGLAHFVEHLTFLGSARRGQPLLEERLVAAALDHNAFTRWDDTHYTESALAEHWPELLDVEAARMNLSCDTIDAALFERERAVVAQELAQRHTSQFDSLLGAIFGAGHPYGHSAGGTDLAALTRADACAFLGAHYAPDRAILIVSGAFDRQQVRSAIIARFGPIARSGVAPVALAPMGALPGRGHVEIAIDIDDPALLFAYPAPRFGSDEAIYQIVTDQMAATALREVDAARKDVTDSAVYEIGGERGGATILSLTLTKDADPDQVAAAVHEKLEAMVRDRSPFYVAFLRGFIYSRLLREYDDLSSRGNMIADYLQFTGTAALHVHDLEVARDLTEPVVLGYALRALVHATPKIIHVVPTADKRDTTSIAKLEPTRLPDLPASSVRVDEREADAPLAAPPPAGDPLEEITLDNGLRVIFALHPSSSLFEARMVFPTGSADDPIDRPGLARLAADQLDVDYARDFDEPTRQRLLAGLQTGTTQHASAVETATVFSSSGIASYAAWHLWWLHLQLETGSYNKYTVAAAQTGDKHDADAARLRAKVLGRLFGASHPFARTPTTTEIEIDELDRFRSAHYVAAGATLIVSGDFDRTSIEHEIRELWGVWPKRARPAIGAIPAAAPAQGPTVFAEDDADEAQVHVRVAFLARSSAVKTSPVRRVAVEMLDLRLAAIREELAASYGVDAGYENTGAGDLVVVQGDIDAIRAAAVLARLDAELARLHDHADELRADFVRARRAALRRALARAGSAESTADEAETIALRDLPLDYFVRMPARVAAVTPADVAELLRGDLDPARMVVIVTGPEAKAAAVAAKLGPITELKTTKK